MALPGVAFTLENFFRLSATPTCHALFSNFDLKLHRIYSSLSTFP